MLTEQASELGLCVIAIPEIISAFCRLQREKKITPTLLNKLKDAFFNDIEDAMICQLTPEVLKISYQLLEKNNLRSMDALHIASSYIWKSDLFISADIRQLTAAQSFGLKNKAI